MVHPNAEHFFYQGSNNVACLLIHGFTGAPADLRRLGQELNQQGYTVSGPLLPGHGTNPKELAGTSWQDWYKAVEEEYQRLAREYKSVFVLGFSMGGLLAIKLAVNYRVAGLISLSTALILPDNTIERIKAEDITRLQDEYIDKKRSIEEKERNLREGRFSYDEIPVKSLLELVKLQEIVWAKLGNVHCPVLVVQSKDDPTVDPESARVLENQLGTTNKSIIWLEKSGHLVTFGPEHKLVENGIIYFLSRLTNTDAQYCFGCGEKNLIGLKLKFCREGEEICTNFLPTKNHQGFPGIMHGGITSAILDEVMAQCLHFEGLNGVTARLEIRYRENIPLNWPVKAKAKIVKRKGPLVDVEGKIWLDSGQVAAESWGRFMLVGGK